MVIEEENSVINNMPKDDTARRYNLAWNYLYEKMPDFKKQEVFSDPESRHNKELTKEVIKLAESGDDIPIVKSNYKKYKKSFNKYFFSVSLIFPVKITRFSKFSDFINAANFSFAYSVF